MAFTHKPKSIEDIVKEAQNFDHKSEYPLRIALRTANNILVQAANCERDGNAEDAYLFLYRHAEFCMTKISSHPDRKNAEFKAAVFRVSKEVQSDLSTLEKLKPEINARRRRYLESVKRINDARAADRLQRRARGGSEQHHEDVIGANHEAITTRSLHAGDDAELALRLAQREKRRRDQARFTQGSSVDELTRNIAALGRQLHSNEETTAPATSAQAQRAYPQVPAHAQVSPTIPSAVPPALPSKQDSTPFPPSRPPKGDALPTLPPKLDEDSSTYTFRPLATSESGAPLRPLFLPTSLRTSFVRLANSNTSRNLETCGILAGTLISGGLFISHLIIPSQISTSDTCDTTPAGDAALFDYVDGEGLLVLGWIHTHPTQTCFLSSRDLHTSVGYQVMLAESIAIVCAPSKDPDHGIFRLTDPPGKQAILACERTGLFHPHEETNLYTDASRPGHVNELEGLEFKVVDLRDKK